MKQPLLSQPKNNYRSVTPTQKDVELARHTSKVLTERIRQHGAVSIHIGKQEQIRLPDSVVRFLQSLFAELSRGHSIDLVPHLAELSTQEAADLLNVSRPFLIQLLEKKQIPSHKIGSHRRVYAEDVLRYKNHTSRKRREVLDELVKQAQELNMGY